MTATSPAGPVSLNVPPGVVPPGAAIVDAVVPPSVFTGLMAGARKQEIPA